MTECCTAGGGSFQSYPGVVLSRDEWSHSHSILLYVVLCQIEDVDSRTTLSLSADEFLGIRLATEWRHGRRHSKAFSWPTSSDTRYVLHKERSRWSSLATGHLEDLSAEDLLKGQLTPNVNLPYVRSTIPVHYVCTGFTTESCFIFSKLTKINIKSGGDAWETPELI